MRIANNQKGPGVRIPIERDSTKFVVSPITGELIPISEMLEHMRISLIHLKYKEQKERMFAKVRETIPLQDDKISRNIVGLVDTIPIFISVTNQIAAKVMMFVSGINFGCAVVVLYDLLIIKNVESYRVTVEGVSLGDRIEMTLFCDLWIYGEDTQENIGFDCCKN